MPVATPRIITILTAAYGPKALYLHETAESIRSLVIPDGWQVEWVVQEDGAAPSLAGLATSMPNVSYEANYAQLGLATTRNLGLNRARGELVRILDHDDVLLPTALLMSCLPSLT